MEGLNKHQMKLLKGVAERNSFTENDIRRTGTKSKGENFMGLVNYITMYDKNGNRKLDLVLKSAFVSEKLRSQMPLDKLYLREIYLYEKVLPELMSFQSNYTVRKPFESFVKMYGYQNARGKESILLEDLRSINYKPWDRKVPMNHKHVEIVLREYARLHAISFAMKELQPEKFAELSANLFDIFEQSNLTEKHTINPMMENYLKSGYEAVKNYPEGKNALKVFADNVEQFFFHELRTEENRLVIIHGDGWSNNLMFQYKEGNNPNDGTPTKVCFLDWQQSKVGSPVIDLAYFLYVCAESEVLLKVDKYLDIYYEALCENLTDFNCDPMKLYSMATFKSHWAKFSKIGLWFSLSLIPVMLREPKESFDLVEAAEKGGNIWIEISTNDKTTDSAELIHKRLLDVIQAMVKTNILKQS